MPLASGPNMGNMMPMRQNQAPAPAPVAPQQPGLGQQVGNWAAKKALTAGINAAVPGGGLAAEGLTTFLPGAFGLFNQGGMIPQYRQHGGGMHGPLHPQEKQYQMKHSNHLTGVTEYKNNGGRVGPLAKTVMKDKDGNSTERHYHNPIQAKPQEK